MSCCSVIDAPWYQPGADPADYFNYGLNPRTWKEYGAAVQKFQTEFAMQRQIEVYDRDGRSRGGNSDMPPELAAAVAQRRAADGSSRPSGHQVHTDIRQRNPQLRVSFGVGTHVMHWSTSFHQRSVGSRLM